VYVRVNYANGRGGDRDRRGSETIRHDLTIDQSVERGNLFFFGITWQLDPPGGPTSVFDLF